jgi:hypothetical protein
MTKHAGLVVRFQTCNTEVLTSIPYRDILACHFVVFLQNLEKTFAILLQFATTQIHDKKFWKEPIAYFL